MGDKDKPNITETQAVNLVEEITNKIRKFTKDMPIEFALVYLKAESIACMDLIKELENERRKKSDSKLTGASDN